MKLTEIMDEWDKDSNIDILELVKETVKSAKLHSKYKRIYITEKLLKDAYEDELKKLNADKYDYYLHGSTDETNAKGWPLLTVTLNSVTVKKYLAGDTDIITLTRKVSLQNEKLDLVEDILKEVGNRSYHLTNIREFMKLSNGY